MAIDHARLEAFMGRAIGDMGGAISVPLMILGDRLGLYRAMRGAGAMTPRQLAQKTGTAERYVREWLMNNAAGGYVTYDAESKAFTLPDEQAMALADDSSAFYTQGAYEVILSLFRDLDKVESVFRTGEGLEWGDHDHCLFSGTARFFKPNYTGNLVSNWIPSLEGVQTKLAKGGKVADFGCGFGHSTILMAEAFPNATFYGFDYHVPSIEAGVRIANEKSVRNAKFQVATAMDYPGNDYDLLTCFDCLHDMADPEGAAKHARGAIKPDGAWMIVEPFAEDAPEANLNPIGRMFYAASTMICVPVSLAGRGPALGAQAGEARLKDVITAGGFTHVRRAAQTPFNLILEARP